MANTKFQKIFYTDSAMNTANPTVDNGVVMNVNGLSTRSPTGTNIITTQATKTGDGATNYQGLPFDQELSLILTGDTVFSGEFDNGQLFSITSQASNTAIYSIDFGIASPQRYVYLDVGQSCSVLKNNNVYYVKSQPEKDIYESYTTGASDIDIDLDDLITDRTYHIQKIDSGVGNVTFSGVTRSTINGRAVADWELNGQWTEINIRVDSSGVYADGDTLIADYVSGNFTVKKSSTQTMDQVYSIIITDTSPQSYWATGYRTNLGQGNVARPENYTILNNEDCRVARSSANKLCQTVLNIYGTTTTVGQYFFAAEVTWATLDIEFNIKSAGKW